MNTARLALVTAFALGGMAALGARPDTTPRRVSSDVLAVLRAAPERAPVNLGRFPLDDGTEAELELTPFSVWAPDARIVVHDAAGAHDLPVPDEKYLRGTVTGHPGSLVVLSAGDVLRGFVFVDDRVLVVAPAADVYRGARPGDASYVRGIDIAREAPPSFPGFQCPEPPSSPRESDPLGVASDPQAALSTTMYAANVAVETDYELYAFFGSSGALTTYVSDLFAAGSAIYQRDVQTQLQVSYLSIWTTPSDPWTATSTSNALMEVGDYWHANRSGVSRTTTHFLSKKNMGGGVAWIGTLCYPDFLCSGGNCGSSAYDGHYGGGYGVSASLNGSFSTTSPSLYWDILCSTHEIGHNFNSPHTHCYNPPVDTCCSCSTGSCTGTVPLEKGTIMSYCHLRPGGYSNIKLFFGVAGETSQAVLTTMRTYVEGRSHAAGCLPVASAIATGTKFYTLAPCRAFDTRNANGTYGGPSIAAGASRSFPLNGRCGIPSTAVSVSLNVTAVAPPAGGFFTLYGGGTSVPATTSISFQAGQVRANNAFAGVSTDGSATLNVWNGSGSAANVVVDVNGYFR